MSERHRCATCGQYPDVCARYGHRTIMDEVPPATRGHRAVEADCQKAIVAGAILAGWRVHAERTSRTQSGGWATAIQGHAGWPDLVLVRPPRLMVVELKRKPNRVDPEQIEWLDRLAACGVETRVIWVPEQQDEFLRELAKR